MFGIFFSNKIIHVLQTCAAYQVIIYTAIHYARFVQHLCRNIKLFFQNGQKQMFRSGFFFLEQARFKHTHTQYALGCFTNSDIMLDSIFGIDCIFNFLFDLSFDIPFVDI